MTQRKRTANSDLVMILNVCFWPIVLIHESGAYVRNRPEAVARLLPYFRTGSIRNLDCQPVDRAEVTPSNDIGRAGSRVE